MKTKISFILTILSLLFTSAFAQKSDKVIVTGSRFTYPLLEKWIAEFKKEYPNVQFHLIARGNLGTDSANLVINAHKLHPEEIKGGTYVVNVGRYALLPVANIKNPAFEEWNVKGIKEKELKKLFFHKYDPFAEEQAKGKPKTKYQPTIYTRAQKACAPISFARNYGFEQEDIIGKVIGGDDHHLISAIEKDTNGLTYNNLGFIYDLKTRKVKSKLAVVPVDFNNNGKLDIDEKIYDNLDQLITAIETNPKLAATEYVNISYAGQVIETNPNVKLFLNWILTNGQKYNHELGFLDFEPNVLAKQKEILVTSVNGQ